MRFAKAKCHRPPFRQRLAELTVVTTLLTACPAPVAAGEGQGIPVRLFGIEGWYEKTPAGDIYLYPFSADSEQPAQAEPLDQSTSRAGRRGRHTAWPPVPGIYRLHTGPRGPWPASPRWRARRRPWPYPWYGYHPARQPPARPWWGR